MSLRLWRAFQLLGQGAGGDLLATGHVVACSQGRKLSAAQTLCFCTQWYYCSRGGWKFGCDNADRPRFHVTPLIYWAFYFPFKILKRDCGQTRTGRPVKAGDFESPMSTNSITLALALALLLLLYRVSDVSNARGFELSVLNHSRFYIVRMNEMPRFPGPCYVRRICYWGLGITPALM